MPIEPLAIGVCSWSLQVKNITELKRLLDRLGVDVVQIACGDPHHAAWDEGDSLPDFAKAAGFRGGSDRPRSGDLQRAVVPRRLALAPMAGDNRPSWTDDERISWKAGARYRLFPPPGKSCRGLCPRSPAG